MAVAAQGVALSFLMQWEDCYSWGKINTAQKTKKTIGVSQRLSLVNGFGYGRCPFDLMFDALVNSYLGDRLVALTTIIFDHALGYRFGIFAVNAALPTSVNFTAALKIASLQAGVGIDAVGY